MDIDLNTLSTGESLTPPVEVDDIFIDRVGMITGSSFGKLIACNKEYRKTDKLNKKGQVIKKADQRKYILSQSETAQNLIYKIVWERLSKEGIISNGLDRLNMSSAATNHGHEFEQEAIQKYIQITGFEVDFKQRFVKYDEYIGGTPDGYIGEDGIIEVKCPFNGGNHIKSLLTGKIYNQDYVYQVQGYLWMTGRKWCDFMTYDPDIIEPLQLKIIRVERDEQIIEALESILGEVKQIIIDLMNNELFKQVM